jgi:hypothetical protein
VVDQHVEYQQLVILLRAVVVQQDVQYRLHG